MLITGVYLQMAATAAFALRPSANHRHGCCEAVGGPGGWGGLMWGVPGCVCGRGGRGRAVDERVKTKWGGLVKKG